MKKALIFLLCLIVLLPCFSVFSFAADLDPGSSDWGALISEGEVLFDSISGSFVVNLHVLNHFRTDANIDDYSTSDVEDGVTFYRVVIDFGRFGCYTTDQQSSINDFVGDEMVLYFTEFAGDASQFVLYSFYLYNSANGDRLTVYHSSDESFEPVGLLYFNFFVPDESSGASLNSWADNLQSFYGDDVSAFVACKREIAMWLFSTDLNTGNYNRTFITYPNDPSLGELDDETALATLGTVTYDSIVGNFAVNVSALDSMRFSANIDLYSEAAVEDGVTFYKVLIDFPSYGCYTDVVDPTVNDFRGDTMILYFTEFAGDSNQFVLYSFYLYNSVTGDDFTVYHSVDGARNVDFIFFNFTQIGPVNWGFDLLEYTSQDFTFNEIKKEIALWLFSTDLDTGYFNRLYITYPSMYEPSDPPSDDDPDDPAQISLDFFDFVMNCFGKLMNVEFFNGWFSIGSVIGLVFAFAAIKLFLKYFAGG